ncbi:hypothetical protein STANM309S_04920 [Streptomyces tanashiensis]
MGAAEVYGTHPEEIAALLNAVGASAMVLSFPEDRAFAALSVGRFKAWEINSAGTGPGRSDPAQ